MALVFKDSFDGDLSDLHVIDWPPDNPRVRELLAKCPTKCKQELLVNIISPDTSVLTDAERAELYALGYKEPTVTQKIEGLPGEHAG